MSPDETGLCAFTTSCTGGSCTRGQTGHVSAVSVQSVPAEMQVSAVLLWQSVNDATAAYLGAQMPWLPVQEITRRVNLQGIWQAAYTAGVVLPKPIATCQYWHRSLNPKKLISINFSRLAVRGCPSSQSGSRVQESRLAWDCRPGEQKVGDLPRLHAHPSVTLSTCTHAAWCWSSTPCSACLSILPCSPGHCPTRGPSCEITMLLWCCAPPVLHRKTLTYVHSANAVVDAGPCGFRSTA